MELRSSCILHRGMSPLLVALVLLCPGLATASRNDFVLHRFRACQSGGTCQDGILYDASGRVAGVEPDRTAFRRFATEFGLAMAPKFLAPAETLGQAGFEFSVETSFTGIDPEADHWKKARAPGSSEGPSPYLGTLQVHLRKGLPFSFELGGTLSHLLQSNALTLGAELKWALNEGFLFLPDLAVRASASRLLGNTDLDLLTGGVDVSVSKAFGIGGMVSVTPYAGWNLVVIGARSNVLDATPGLDAYPAGHCKPPEGDPSGAWQDVSDPDHKAYTAECSRSQESFETRDWEASFVLPHETLTVNRAFLGFRLRITIVSVAAEAIMSPEVNTYSFRFGFDF